MTASFSRDDRLLLDAKVTKVESKSQRKRGTRWYRVGCCLMLKLQKLKASHNTNVNLACAKRLLLDAKVTKVESKSQLLPFFTPLIARLLLDAKVTKVESKSQRLRPTPTRSAAVA